MRDANQCPCVGAFTRRRARGLPVPCRGSWRQPYPYYGAVPASSHTEWRGLGLGVAALKEKECAQGNNSRVRGEDGEGMGVPAGARAAVSECRPLAIAAGLPAS